MAYQRKSVEAPTEITFGSVAGEPMLLNGPASPEETTTVTLAATAASSNCLTASASLRSGIGSLPDDSFSTLTWAPVRPRDRGVLALGTVEWVCVTGSASGSSWTPPLGRQAPGRVLMADDAAAGAEGAAGLWP